MMDDKQLTEEYLDGKVVFPGKIIRVEHWHVRLPNGETALREVACHPGAAGIVALDDDGNVILVRQHRIAVGRLTLEIPAGKLDGVDEDPFVCAQRELSEETGLTVTAIRRAVRDGWLPYIKPGKAYLFRMEDVRAAIEKRMEEQAKKDS